MIIAFAQSIVDHLTSSNLRDADYGDLVGGFHVRVNVKISSSIEGVLDA